MMTNSSFDPAFIFDSEYKKIPDELRSRVSPSCSLPSWRTLTGTRTGTRWRERFSIIVAVGVVFSVICCGSVLQFAGKRVQQSQFKKDPAPPADLREEPVKQAKARKLKSELCCQLNAARTTSAQEWVADTNVAGSGDLVSAITDLTVIPWNIGSLKTAPTECTGG